MDINEATKIIARFHTKQSGRGLNIYNPFFEENNINALYVLFYNEEPKKLIEGFRNFKLFGAITAGFESNEELPKLLDEVGDEAMYVGKIGYIKNDNGAIVGHAQGGEGMYKTLLQVSSIDNSNIAIVGAGNIAKGLLYSINKNKHKCNVDIYNRNVDKAEIIKKDFGFVKNVYGLSDFGSKKYDVLLNLTDLGGSVEDAIFNEQNISNFEAVVDVTFEKENTNLIDTAKKLGKKYATGWDMFTNQGLVILKDLFGQDFEFEVFKKYVVNGLSSVVK